MRYVLNGQDITDRPFSHNGIKYPANWARLATEQQLIALGIDVIPEPGQEADEPAAQFKTVFTSLEFLDRFTEAEQLAVVSASMNSAEVKLWWDKMLAASYVDLNDPRTAAGVDALIFAGLLEAERRDAVLAPEEIQT